MDKPILYYIHDPMCSWCWGFTASLESLLEKLPADIKVQRLLGGLAPDSNIVMPDTMKESIKSNWVRIEDTIPGVKFNFDFWSQTIPRRSTYPACRAVIAAQLQGEKYDVLMTKAIQRAYYQEARNPSDNSTLTELAIELGLSSLIFEKDLASEQVQSELIKEINMSRSLFAESFPSLVLDTGKKTISINIKYNNSDLMLEAVMANLLFGY